MTVQALVPPQFVKAAPLEPMNEDASATAFLLVANSSLLPDLTLAMLAGTAAGWSVPTLASETHVSVEYGRIRMAGHVDDASPLESPRRALLRLSGVSGLDMMVTVEALANPLRTCPTTQHSQHVE